MVEEIEKSEIREIVEGNYRKIYRIVDANTVGILRVHHGSQDLIRRIEKQ